MISTPKSFPHYRVNVKDNSIYDVTYNEVLPVHRPCYVIKAQRGEVNKLVWCPTYEVAVATFGEETFNPSNKKYFSLSALYLKNTLQLNGAFIMRIADEVNASAAIAILEAHVSEVDDIPQYETDSSGNRIKFRNSDNELDYVKKTEIKVIPIGNPMLDEDGNQMTDVYGNPILTEEETSVEVPVVEPGLKIQWRVRTTLQPGEQLDNLLANPTDGIYPIMAFEALSVGAHGNDVAFSLFYDKNENSSSTLEAYESVFYSFEAALLPPGTSVPVSIQNAYGPVASFAANVDQTYFNMENVLTRVFANTTNILPYNIYTYEENFKVIGNLIAEIELNSDSYTNGGLGFIDANNYKTFEGVTLESSGFKVTPESPVGYRVNVVSGLNINGSPYDHVIIDTEDSSEDAALLQRKGYHYLEGGSDGNFDDDDVEKKLISFFRGELPADGSIVDKFRYPITHFYDPGFSMDVKYEMLDFLTIRDDVVVELSTQEVTDSSEWNTRQIDERHGEFLRAKTLLQHESFVNGTQCCRCAIYPQSGILADGSYNGIVPFTFWSAMKHAQYGNAPTMSVQEPRGLPYSLNEYFKSYNWLNFDEAGQSRVWDKGMNYCQAADKSRIFYPALRSVYRADTSVLTDQWFVDAVVYTKHVIRDAWATHVGRNDTAAVINDDLAAYLVASLTKLYNGKYTFDVSVTQSEEEKKLGYVRHALIRITSPATFRVLEVDVEVNREDYNETTEEQ